MGTKRVQRILAGDWPNKLLTPDEQVEVANEAADILVAKGGPADPEAVMDDINNFALWLGGMDRDVQVYAWQLIRRVKGIEVLATDKTHARLEPLEDKIFAFVPYEAKNFETINHYPWPKLFNNTFEERLEQLADEMAAEDTAEITPVDLLLSGRETPPADLDVDNTYRLIIACLDELKAFLDKYEGRTNILYYERFDNFIKWITTLQPELAIMAMRSALTVYQLPVKDRKSLPSVSDFVAKFKGIIP